MSKTPTRYSVRPRYSGGSPGLVSEEIAQRVASQEKEEYEVQMSGMYGPIKKMQAEVGGLQYIVEAMTERKNGFDIVDLITGQHRRREKMKASKVRVGDFLVDQNYRRHKVERAHAMNQRTGLAEILIEGQEYPEIQQGEVLVERIVRVEE